MLAAAPLLTNGLIHSAAAELFSESSSGQTGVLTDWSRSIVDSTMHRIPDPQNLGGWGYAISLYLYGQFLVYKRIGDRKYLEYIQGWVDRHINDEGVIDRSISALDYMLPGNLLLVLYSETKEEKYRKAAESIRKRLET